MASVNYQTYKNLVKQNFVDGKIDDSKIAMLNNLRKTLRIADEEHEQILSELTGEMSGAPAVEEKPAETPATDTPSSSDANTLGSDGVHTLGSDGVHTLGGSSSEPEDKPPSSGIVRSFGDASTDKSPDDTSAAATIQRVSTDTSKEIEEPKAAPAASGSFDDLLNQGKEAYRAGKYQDAYDFCTQALEVKPNNSQALFFKKRAKSKLGDNVKKSSPAQERSDPMMSHMAKPQEKKPVENSLIPKCLSCRDTGTCSWCKGEGSCWMCHGTGKCNNCKGSGIVDDETCPKCKGSGECDSCIGSGKCYWCKGSGKCHKCGG